MTDALLPLSVCLVIGLLWYDAMTARELAIMHARRLCAEHGAQMLDQSVALHSLRLGMYGGWPRLVRSYRFDLSYAGSDRHRASLLLIGDRMFDYSLPAPEQPMFGPAEPGTQAGVPPGGATGGNVVPLARPLPRTLH